MSASVTDFIVAGPAGHTTAGPAGSFMAGPAGHTGSHVPIDTSIARIPYAAPSGGSSSTFVASGGSVVAGGGSTAIGGPGGVSLGGDSSATHIGYGGGGIAKENSSGVGIGQTTTVGSTNVSVPTEPGKPAIAPATSGRGGGGVSAGPFSSPGHKSVDTTGQVPIAPTLGIQPISPAGRVSPTPGIGFSMPTMTGFVPINPGGSIQAFRQTTPHGMYFGHTQHWPNDVLHHNTHSAGYDPKHISMAPWVPTMDGYEEPHTPKVEFDDQSGPSTGVDMSMSYNMSIDQSQDIELTHNTHFNDSIENTLDQSMNTTIHNTEVVSNESTLDTSREVVQDLSEQVIMNNANTNTQVTNQQSVVNSTQEISNHQDSSTSYSSTENRQVSAENRHVEVKNIDAGQVVNDVHITDQSERDNTTVRYVNQQDVNVSHDNSMHRSEDHSVSMQKVSETNYNQVDNAIFEQNQETQTVIDSSHESAVAFSETKINQTDNSHHVDQSIMYSATYQDNSREMVVDNNTTNIVDKDTFSVVYNNTSENNLDQSRNIDQSTIFNFVEQDNSVVHYINDNDTRLVENDNTSLEFSDTRVIEADNSNTIEIHNNVNQIDVDNSETNFINAQETRIVNIDQPSFHMDLSQELTMNFQAPERAGGDLIIGNA